MSRTDHARIQPFASFNPDFKGQMIYDWKHLDADWRVYDLMQCTGLHDKNGKEIWEGDVVKLPGINPKLVFFEPNTASFRIGTDSNQNPASTHPMTLSSGHWEVLGDIYQNPELLK